MTVGGRYPPGRARPDYGRGEYSIDSVDQLFSPEALVSHLRKTLGSPQYEPPLLPATALDLMRLTRQPGVSLVEVRQLLERDPVLAARVLQLAQSALYSRGAPVQSLQDAISRLGLRTMGDLFLQTVMSARVFKASGYEQPMAALLRHSTLTAHISRLTCRATALPDDYAFMCGLLHDVGMAAGLLIFADTSRGTANAPKRLTPPDFADVSVALEVVHSEASAIVAEAWKLNPDVALVIGNHHRPRIGRHVHPLAAVVCVSDWIATEAGAGVAGEIDPDQARTAADSLGISASQLAALGDRGRELASAM